MNGGMPISSYFIFQQDLTEVRNLYIIRQEEVGKFHWPSDQQQL